MRIGKILMPYDFEVAEKIRYDILLGRDWLIATECKTTWINGQFSFSYNGKKSMLHAYQEVGATPPVKHHVTIEDADEDDPDDGYEEIEEDSQDGEFMLTEEDSLQVCTQREWTEVVDSTAEMIPVETCNSQEVEEQEALELSEEKISQLKIGSDLSKEENQQLGELFMKYSKHFAYQLEDLERCTIDPLVIDLQGAQPIKVKSYRILMAQSDWLRKELKKLEELNFIRRCFGPWATSIFLVKKKDGKWRIVQDF